MNKTIKHILKKILFSKYLCAVFGRIYYLKFRLTGGKGGKPAQRYLKQLNKSEFASLDELEHIQNNKLKKLIKEVYQYVPYYRTIMRQKGVTPSDIKSKDDLQVFPLLTKQKIRDNFDNLLNVRYKKKEMTLVMTGGTTGTPLQFYFSKHELGVRAAHWERWKKFAGLKQFDKFIYIGMDQNAEHNPNYKGTFTLYGCYVMASFGLDDNLMWKYWENIKRFKPVYLRGFASACYLLADFIRRNNIHYPLKAVLSSSDMLYPYQKKVIEETFSCEVFDHYGLVEDIVAATECEYHDGFHITMESCVVEVIDEDGSPVPAGEMGTIVGTNLENY
ncbi:phenylacetate--CoA ligase family protein, partial [Candidatus Pacearchaeota archaeon]|nr:phenylacetate--CoA ligase family protein [Candidatus Pacearchaeota archaeon]